MRQTIQELVERYQNSLYAVAFNVCKNQQDAEDAVQDTFLQYYNSKKEFESEQHIRAWLIRVAINKAKNMNLSFWRKNKTSLGHSSFKVSRSNILPRDNLTLTLLSEIFRISPISLTL